MGLVSSSVGGVPFSGDLSQFDFNTEYRSLKEDPASAFYRRCLLNSNKYKRAVGYFKSSVYMVVGGSIVEFARRGGTIKLICSPQISNEDLEGISSGYNEREVIIERRLVADIDSLLAEAGGAYTVKILATLIAAGSLDVRLAVRSDRKGLYHEKIGIFADGVGNKVSFKGSANETWSGWHPDGNFESIEVFCTWRGGLEAERVKKHEAHFDSLWSGQDTAVEVVEFPRGAMDHLKSFALKGGLESVDALIPSRDIVRSALPHQSAALTAWAKAGYRGVFEHATGSGKTFTAILAIRQHIALGLPAVVLVPSKLLLEQWAAELRMEVPNAALLTAGGGHIGWKTGSRVRGMTASDKDLGGRILLATMQTASSDAFRSQVSGGSHLLLVADEVHQIGSPANAKVLQIDAGKRLGLSATPKRFGDPEGTKAIFDYFGSVVPPAITLQDAIKAGRLVEYEYFPHPINLTAAEADEWGDLSRAIRLEMAKQREDAARVRRLSDRAKLLLIRRSRIAKKAEKKVQLAFEVLSKHYEEGQHWLIYCEDGEQLGQVLQSLRAAGIPSTEYHSSMMGDREATMEWFRAFGGPLVSIRCLDEGVDIPAVSHALILASSQNPRQFIQRRGRVLRKSANKRFAVIHDAIVVPTSLETEPEQAALLRAELLRSIEFAGNAINKSAGAELRDIAAGLGLDPDEIMDTGFEDEANDGE